MTGAVFQVFGWILAAASAPDPAYPPARVDAAVETRHGVSVPDPYRWMEDLESEETKRWIGAQEELFRSFVEGVPGREEFQRRILGLSDRELFVAPVQAGDRYFLTKITSTGVPAGLWVQNGRRGASRLLIDPRSRGAGMTLGVFAPSPDGRRVAYTV